MYQSLRVSIQSQTMPPEDNAAHGGHYAFVFDGLGGAGGGKRLNEKGESVSEAKIASGAAADALNQWAREHWERWRDALASAGNPDALTAFVPRIVRELGAAFRQGLWEAAAQWNAQKLPTTVAGWLTFPAPDGKTLAIALWAGDSRCYTLDADSMKLYSRDDAEKSRRRDAMRDCLNGDSLPMNNRMGIDNAWRLNYNYNTFEGPILLLSCTDGFYNCMESPMHLEYYLRQLGGWEASDDAEEWKPESFQDMGNKWEQFILEENLFADDSATLETIFINPDPEDITALRALLSSAERVRELEEAYIAPFPEEYQAQTFSDLDAQVRAAAKRLCAENDRYGFLHALRENALRLAKDGAAPLDMRIPCAQTVLQMRFQYQARRKERENPAEEESYAKLFDDYLSVNRLRDAKYILESWIERGETPEGYRFPSALSEILNENAAALRERKKEHDAVIARHKRLNEEKIKLWEGYKPEFEAFAEPPLYVDVDDERKGIRNNGGANMGAIPKA